MLGAGRWGRAGCVTWVDVCIWFVGWPAAPCSRGCSWDSGQQALRASWRTAPDLQAGVLQPATGGSLLLGIAHWQTPQLAVLIVSRPHVPPRSFQAKDYKYVGSQKQQQNGGGIVIRDMEAAGASGAAPAGAAADSKDGGRQMEADEEFARQLQAKMDAEMRAK